MKKDYKNKIIYILYYKKKQKILDNKIHKKSTNQFFKRIMVAKNN